jgi:hypothetical protein
MLGIFQGVNIMPKTVIFDHDRATLWFYPETKIVHHEIKKYVYGPELREILDQGYELLKKNKAQKWLSDDRRNGPLTAEDTQWAKTDWFPRVVAAGWKYWAIIMPEKATGVMNMQKFKAEYAQAGVIVNVFNDPDEGLKWLESQ